MNITPHGYEAECSKCGEIFLPADKYDVIHLGGIGVCGGLAKGSGPVLTDEQRDALQTAVTKAASALAHVLDVWYGQDIQGDAVVGAFPFENALEEKVAEVWEWSETLGNVPTTGRHLTADECDAFGLVYGMGPTGNWTVDDLTGAQRRLVERSKA